MRHQQTILIGTIIWFTGCYLDIKLFQYAYLLIIIGSIIASMGAIVWLKSKENRIRLKETLKPKTDFGEMIK